MPPPKKFMEHTQKWLQSAFRYKFKNMGDYLVHGVQNDSFSCGILLSNTISHAIFHTPIWIPRQGVFERVSWFVELVKGGIMDRREHIVDQIEGNEFEMV